MFLSCNNAQNAKHHFLNILHLVIKQANTTHVQTRIFPEKFGYSKSTLFMFNLKAYLGSQNKDQSCTVQRLVTINLYLTSWVCTVK